MTLNSSSSYNWYNDIKEYYDMGLYDNNDVKEFVKSGWITPEDYKSITGEDYVA